MTMINLILALFATYRLTYDITSKWEFAGAFGIYGWIRSLLKRDDNPEWVREGADCPFCVSQWTAGFVAVLVICSRGRFEFIASISELLLWSLGLAGVVSFFYSYVLGVWHGVKADRL